jgi:hypothetical protein
MVGTAARLAVVLAAAAALAGCGASGDDGDVPPPSGGGTGIEIVNSWSKDVLLEWFDKNLGHHGYGNHVVPACSDRPVRIKPGSYRLLLFPAVPGAENIDWEVIDRVDCCIVISRRGRITVTEGRPPPLRCP